MTRDAQKILEEALGLPEVERAKVAASLIESLDGPAEPDAEAAWDVELARRIEEFDRGEVETVPWSDLRRRLLGEEPGEG
jgi:putative addiction module component (TIGR02574 family)